MSLLPPFGPPESLRRRLETSRAALFRLAYCWCHDRALADDLTQEALAKAVMHADQLRDAQRLRSWLYGILAVDEALLASEHTPELAASQAQLAARVRAAVERLPLGQREVLALVDLEECSYAEVAEILAIPIGTVMSRLCRGRANLRAALAGAWGAPAAVVMRRVK